MTQKHVISSFAVGYLKTEALTYTVLKGTDHIKLKLAALFSDHGHSITENWLLVSFRSTILC